MFTCVKILNLNIPRNVDLSALYYNVVDISASCQIIKYHTNCFACSVTRIKILKS